MEMPEDCQCLDGCERCRLFRCVVCGELVSWSQGFDTDDMPDACDDCWAKAHPEATSTATLNHAPEAP